MDDQILTTLVTRFPGQGIFDEEREIPTILYYDHAGHVQAAGAEATTETVEMLAEENGWTKAEG